mmetsp:Transcript_158702/g.295866  ORF Transcript_158702/g.295866 Transcript_158702/m.295866 type:complete len:174 (-) Transcript_158702:48-569(-)
MGIAIGAWREPAPRCITNGEKAAPAKGSPGRMSTELLGNGEAERRLIGSAVPLNSTAATAEDTSALLGTNLDDTDLSTPFTAGAGVNRLLPLGKAALPAPQACAKSAVLISTTSAAIAGAALMIGTPCGTHKLSGGKVASRGSGVADGHRTAVGGDDNRVVISTTMDRYGERD